MPADPQTTQIACYIVALPPERWSPCKRCGGTGSEVMERDMHRSYGIIPCRETGCHGGTIKAEVVERHV